MPRLYLLRHAKAAWAAPGTSDFDRPLTPEGMRAARTAGSAFGDGSVGPAAVLCSPALRTRQTLEGVTAGFARQPPVHYLQPLYDGGAQAYLDALRSAGDASSVLIVGHNPMTEDIGDALTKDGEAGALTALRAGFPVCGMAIIDFDKPFASIKRRSGTLHSFAVHEG